MNVKRRIGLALLALLLVGCATAATIQIILAYGWNPDTVLLEFNDKTFTGHTVFSTDLAWLPLVWGALALTALVGFFVGAGVLTGVLFMFVSLALPFLLLLALAYFTWKYRHRFAAKFS